MTTDLKANITFADITKIHTPITVVMDHDNREAHTRYLISTREDDTHVVLVGYCPDSDEIEYAALSYDLGRTWRPCPVNPLGVDHDPVLVGQHYLNEMAELGYRTV